MSDNKDTVVRILGSRPTSRPEPHPAPIPADATIYNGSELLLGSQSDGMGLGWVGAPIAASGADYAAILADDPYAEEWRAHNRAVGAIVVEYVTLAEVRQTLERYYRDTLSLEPDEIREQLESLDDAGLWLEYVVRGLHIDRAGEPAYIAIA